MALGTSLNLQAAIELYSGVNTTVTCILGRIMVILRSCFDFFIPSHYSRFSWEAMASEECCSLAEHTEGGGGESAEHAEATVSDVLIKCSIGEKEFGSGTLDCNYQSQMWTGMGKLFRQETLSDVMLMAEGQSIPCHKFLLAALSEHLCKLVAAPEGLKDNLLEIEGITFQTLKVIVNYMYTGYIDVTVENAGDVMAACRTLELCSAYETCEAYLMEKVTPANCISLHKVAAGNDALKLKERAHDVMMKKFKTVASGTEFLDMATDEVEEYIQNENLRIHDEDPVYDAVISWVRQKPEERTSYFSQLIKSVRLRYCSTYCLEHIVPHEPLMEAIEFQKLLFSALKHQSPGGFCFDKAHKECKDCAVFPRKGYGSTSNMVIIGGISDPGDVTRRDCWHWDDATWEHMEDCAVPTEIRLFSACVAGDGIVVTGGDHNGKLLSQCWQLSTSTYQWSPLPDLVTARCRHASVCVGGQVYVIAGEGLDGKEMSSVECLEKHNTAWKVVPAAPKSLVHTLAVGHKEKIYVLGGKDLKWNDSESCYMYDTNSKVWQKLSDMPQPCKFGSAVAWKDMIYVVGGFERSCMSFNPALSAWTILSQCVHEHGDAPAVVWKDRILVCGGRSRDFQRPDDKPHGTSVVEEYDPVKDTWISSQIDLPGKLYTHFVFCTQD